jgi:hypothetical protein
MRIPLLLAALLLAACHDKRPPAPDAADNARLDEAGNMLDALANEEGAAPEDAAPSDLANEGR